MQANTNASVAPTTNTTKQQQRLVVGEEQGGDEGGTTSHHRTHKTRHRCGVVVVVGVDGTM